MKLLFLGDIVGRSGRAAVLQQLPMLQKCLAPDLIIVNAENAAGGYGLTTTIARELLEAGIACLTMGNHLWDQKELVHSIEQFPTLIRPLNYPSSTPGRGTVILTTARGERILVVNLVARLFMEPSDNPFTVIEEVLKEYRLGETINAIVVDFHGEATSEKMAMGHLLDGRVSLIVGTHTHVPTADHQILPRGSAYITDVGMCGDYDSVIGMKKEVALMRFTSKHPSMRLSPAEEEASVCGVLCQIDERGLAQSISPVRVGGRLSKAL